MNRDREKIWYQPSSELEPQRHRPRAQQASDRPRLAWQWNKSRFSVQRIQQGRNRRSSLENNVAFAHVIIRSKTEQQTTPAGTKAKVCGQVDAGPTGGADTDWITSAKGGSAAAAAIIAHRFRLQVRAQRQRRAREARRMHATAAAVAGQPPVSRAEPATVRVVVHRPSAHVRPGVPSTSRRCTYQVYRPRYQVVIEIEYAMQDYCHSCHMIIVTVVSRPSTTDDDAMPPCRPYRSLGHAMPATGRPPAGHAEDRTRSVNSTGKITKTENHHSFLFCRVMQPVPTHHAHVPRMYAPGRLAYATTGNTQLALPLNRNQE